MSNVVVCAECGRLLPEKRGLALEDRSPCPNCGSVLRKYSQENAGDVEVASHLSGAGRRGSTWRSFFETHRDGIATSAQPADTEGIFRFSLEGLPPQGEFDTINVCKVLIARLNREAGNWSDPIVGVEPADCVSYKNSDSNQKIEIQVVRAIVEPTFWRLLRSRLALKEQSASLAELGTHLRSAIQKKATDRRIPAALRRDLILALDATRLPVLALEAVATHFRDVHGAWASSLGFSQIWVVGPTETFCQRLDSPEKPINSDGISKA